MDGGGVLNPGTSVSKEKEGDLDTDRQGRKPCAGRGRAGRDTAPRQERLEPPEARRGREPPPQKLWREPTLSIP